MLKVYFLGCFGAFEAEAEADTTYAGACAESDAETASEPCAASVSAATIPPPAQAPPVHQHQELN